MKTLDRYILRNFLFTLVMFLIVGILLRGVVDLFINLDEFAEVEMSFVDRVKMIGQYYACQSVAYFGELGGVLIVASAVFTLARMNKTNELTAMLAAGVSLHRVLLPIVISSMLMGGLIMLNQEFVIPPLAPKLVRDPDDAPGIKTFQVRLMTDGAGSVWYSEGFSPVENVMSNPVVILRDHKYKAIASIVGTQARPGELDGVAGWFIEDGSIGQLGGPGTVWRDIPDSRRIYTIVDPARILTESGQHPKARRPRSVRNPQAEDRRYHLRVKAAYFRPGRSFQSPGGKTLRGGSLERPRFIFRADDGRTLATFLATSADFHADEHGGHWRLYGGTLFCPSDLTGDYLILRRSSWWLQYMSTSELTRLLKLKRVPDEEAARLARHIRFADPINNVIMLLLGVPFILSRERNVKAAASLCLLMVATFYVFIYICRYIGLPAVWAAGLPVVLFGPIAAVTVDSIKT